MTEMIESTAYPFIDDEEERLIISKPLAQALGLSKSIIFRQILYWMKLNKRADKSDHFKDGLWWTYNSYKDWQDDNFCFWAYDTIRRNLVALRKAGLLFTTTKYNQRGGDQTIWYTINFGAYNAFIKLWREHGCPMHGDGAKSVAYTAFIEDWDEQKNAYTNMASCTPQYGILHTPSVQSAMTVTKDYPETTANKKTKKKRVRKAPTSTVDAGSSAALTERFEQAPTPPTIDPPRPSTTQPVSVVQRQRFTMSIYGGQDTYADGKFINPMNTVFIDECNAIFYAWLDSLDALGRKPDTSLDDLWEKHRTSVKALAMNRRTPEQVSAFVKYAYSDKYPGDFFRKSPLPITLGAISSGIQAWLTASARLAQNSTAAAPTLNLPENVVTPERAARIRQEALLQRAAAGGGR